MLKTGFCSFAALLHANSIDWAKKAIPLPDYEQRVSGYEAILFTLASLLAVAGWNVGMKRAEFLAGNAELATSNKARSITRPERPDVYGMEDQNKDRATIEEYERQYLELDLLTERLAGEQDALKSVQNTINQNQWELIEFQWFAGFIFFFLFLGNIREWFEKYEEKLTEKKDNVDKE